MMTRFVKYVVPVVAAALFAVAVLHVIGTSREPSAKSPSSFEQPPTSPFADTVAGAGIVEPRTENISVGASLPGVVEGVLVTVGQRVKAGDPLFKLDDRELQAELKVKQAQLESAQADLDRLKSLPRPEDLPVSEAQVNEARANAIEKERYLTRRRDLLKKNAATPEEVDTAYYDSEAAKAALARAEAQFNLLKAGTWKYEINVAAAAVGEARTAMEQVQTNLDRLTTTAPVDSEILQVNVRPGEFVGAPPGQALIVLGNTQELNVRIDIDENDIPRYRPGAKAMASLKGDPRHRFPLTFVRVEPYVIPKKSLTGGSNERIDTRVLQVIYRVDNGPRLYVGQQVDAYIDAGPPKKTGGRVEE